MAPLQRMQRTFVVIPEAPSFINDNAKPETPAGRSSKPPMTTKQAKKLHKQANKAPKLSKAEQRRLDLMEQDRIRKELEKEKHQARALKARDKRKEKEDKERAEKRKRGLPLVEVHPSQDTLARFLSFGMPQTKPKKVAEQISPPAVGVGDDRNVILSDKERNVVSSRKESPLRPVNKERTENPQYESDDSQGSCGTLEALRAIADSLQNPAEKATDEEAPSEASSETVASCSEDDDTPDEATPKASGVEGNLPPATGQVHQPQVSSISAATPKPLPRLARAPMLPSPALKRAAKASFLPPSTQSLLENADDLFPTASQEARELFNHDSPPAPTVSAMMPPPRRSVLGGKETSPAEKMAGKASPQTESFSNDGAEILYQDTMPFFSTQDLFLSSQDIKDLQESASPSKAPNTLARKELGGSSTNKVTSFGNRSRPPFVTRREEQRVSPAENSATVEGAHANRPTTNVPRHNPQPTEEDETERLLLMAAEDVESRLSGSATGTALPVRGEANKRKESDRCFKAQNPAKRQRHDQRSKRGHPGTNGGRPISQYGKLLQCLEGRSSEPPPRRPSSQETDYGDEELADDDLYAFL